MEKTSVIQTDNLHQIKFWMREKQRNVRHTHTHTHARTHTHAHAHAHAHTRTHIYTYMCSISG